MRTPESINTRSTRIVVMRPAAGGLAAGFTPAAMAIPADACYVDKSRIAACEADLAGLKTEATLAADREAGTSVPASAADCDRAAVSGSSPGGTAHDPGSTAVSVSVGTPQSKPALRRTPFFMDGAFYLMMTTFAWPLCGLETSPSGLIP